MVYKINKRKISPKYLPKTQVPKKGRMIASLESTRHTLGLTVVRVRAHRTSHIRFSDQHFEHLLRAGLQTSFDLILALEIYRTFFKKYN